MSRITRDHASGLVTGLSQEGMYEKRVSYRPLSDTGSSILSCAEIVFGVVEEVLRARYIYTTLLLP